MGIAKVVFYKTEDDKFRWKFVDRNGKTLAETTNTHETQDEALAEATLVTGIVFEFDNLGHSLGLHVFRSEPVGVSMPTEAPELIPNEPMPEPSDEIVGDPEEEIVSDHVSAKDDE